MNNPGSEELIPECSFINVAWQTGKAIVLLFNKGCDQDLNYVSSQYFGVKFRPSTPKTS
jgi:hypothetical protein